MSPSARMRPALVSALLFAVPMVVSAQQSGSTAVLALDSLLSTPISAASKYVQTSAEAPASVTILTSEDLERSGYRTLGEALESVRGFYVSSDRNFSYLGTRGFARPGDYNNRILLLVDGHTINDQTWGGAPMGGELPIAFDAVERIEIVRGPGSALYGTSAMFAVINVVTKTGAALDGIVARAESGTGGRRQASVAAGRAFGSNVSFTASGLVLSSAGRDLFFPEFDTPESNGGVATGLDWERAQSGLASLRIGDVVGRVGYRTRAKGIPTAAFDMAFNDPRAETVDETFWAEVSGSRAVGSALRVSSRVYGDRYRYRGVYPYDAGPAMTDGGGSTAFGSELLTVWEWTSRNRLTLGSEIRRVLRADYYERSTEGAETSDNVPSSIVSLFVQDELQLHRNLTLVGGIRSDRTSLHGQAIAPRLALIATPTTSTTLKALVGDAFRAPSPAEADITTTFYSRNASLKPERIRSAELGITQRVSNAVLLSASLYGYQLRDLIDQVELPADGSVVFDNRSSSEGSGAELELELHPSSAVTARASYAYQRSRDNATGLRLTNSPEQVAMTSVTTAAVAGIRPTVAVRYESGRRTLAGPATSAFVRTDANFTYAPSSIAARWLEGSTVGLRVTNLFDVRYSTPGGLEHRQVANPQDGRAVSLQLSWRF